MRNNNKKAMCVAYTLTGLCAEAWNMVLHIFGRLHWIKYVICLIDCWCNALSSDPVAIKEWLWMEWRLRIRCSGRRWRGWGSSCESRGAGDIMDCNVGGSTGPWEPYATQTGFGLNPNMDLKFGCNSGEWRQFDVYIPRIPT
jgi:hypothetical protein